MTENGARLLLFAAILFVCQGQEVSSVAANLIITNNPLVAAREGARFYPEATLLEVLTMVRDLVHQNYRLITHPLAGSVKPNQTPYKSVILSAEPGHELDYTSLQLVEGSLQVAQRMLSERPLPAITPRVLADFALIDSELIR